jgi:hypothetical protein
MRLLIDLEPDLAGRPVGTVRPVATVRLDDDAAVESFADWLDLLRVLETFIETTRRTSHTRMGDQ